MKDSHGKLYDFIKLLLSLVLLILFIAWAQLDNNGHTLYTLLAK